jgi:hypothetical protein
MQGNIALEAEAVCCVKGGAGHVNLVWMWRGLVSWNE